MGNHAKTIRGDIIIDKVLLRELIVDMDDVIEHTAGETKCISGKVRNHLKEFLRLEEQHIMSFEEKLDELFSNSIGIHDTVWFSNFETLRDAIIRVYDEDQKNKKMR